MSWLDIFTNKQSRKQIFLDYASTTPMLPEVERAMQPYWSEKFYNPSAIYDAGRQVRQDVERCREQVARLLGAGKKDIVFTSGGTESNNMVIMGAFESALEEFERPHLIISAIEHSSIKATAEEVKRRGGEVSILLVNGEGLVDPEELENLIRPETFLVSVMLANNEIGTIEPIANLGRVVRAYRKSKSIQHPMLTKGWPLLHTDASQAPNYLEVNVEKLQADLVTLDGSKIYGPKGVGVLVVRPNARIRPTTLGGGQERGLRSGSENPALIVGFAKALALANENRESEFERVSELRKVFVEELKRNVPEAEVNGPKESVLPNIVSVSLAEDRLAELTLLALEQEGVLVSTGSTCSFLGEVDGSDVIEAIGKPDKRSSTLRFSFGRDTRMQDVIYAVKVLSKLIKKG